MNRWTDNRLPSEKSKILIIKIGGIGDVACALLAFTYLKHQEITWITGKGSEPLLSSCLQINRVLCVDDHVLVYGSIIKKIIEVLKIWKCLWWKRFDLVIRAHKHPLYKILVFPVRKKNYVFFKKKERFPLGNQFQGSQYYQLLSKHHVPQFLLPELSLPTVDHLFPKGKHKPWIVLTPQETGYEGKQLRAWPLMYYAKLAKWLSSYDCEVVIVGEKESEYINTCFAKIPVRNLIGKTSLMELVAILKLSLGIVTQDGGPLHLARLVGCKICAIFGPTSPKDFSLSSSNEIALWGGDGLGCRPCYNGKKFPKCTHQSCMKQVSPEQVLDIIIKEWNLKKHENSYCP